MRARLILILMLTPSVSAVVSHNQMSRSNPYALWQDTLKQVNLQLYADSPLQVFATVSRALARTTLVNSLQARQSCLTLKAVVYESPAAPDNLW